jgi:acetyltransferase-like isoleucine patch superfamily enzyme
MRGAFMKIRQILHGIWRRIFGPFLPDLKEYKDLRAQYPQYTIGVGSYADSLDVHTWGDDAKLVIGRYCSFASDVQIFLGGEHRTDWVTTYPFSVKWPAGAGLRGHPRTKGDVIIGSDVWIALEAIITSGVEIGHGAVVGARSVVTRNVPPYAIVAGNPARLIRYRFTDATVIRLLKTRWWDRDESWIEAMLPLLCSNEIDKFLLAAESDT